MRRHCLAMVFPVRWVEKEAYTHTRLTTVLWLPRLFKTEVHAFFLAADAGAGAGEGEGVACHLFRAKQPLLHMVAVAPVARWQLCHWIHRVPL